MNAIATERQELKRFIDVIPERSFGVVRNFLSYLAESVLGEPLVIEPASAEESAIIDKAMQEYEKDPTSFKKWEAVKKEMALL